MWYINFSLYTCMYKPENAIKYSTVNPLYCIDNVVIDPFQHAFLKAPIGLCYMPFYVPVGITAQFLLQHL